MDDGTPDPAPDPGRDLPSLRASDTERETTVMMLQNSYSEGRLTLAEFDERTTLAYAARFQSELAELTQDLPAVRSTHDDRPEVRRAELPARRVTGGSGPSTSLAVMGGVERTGVWTLPAEHTVFAMMGGIEIDLRRANLQGHETTIRAFAIMGGVEIIVPDDVHVDVEGLGVMGWFGEESGESKKDPRPVRQAPPGAPTIRVTGLALMAGIGVRRVPRDSEPD